MIYNLGSINIDHLYRVPHLVRAGETLASTGYSRVLGGKGANQSFALARAGAQVTHLGAVGQGDGWAIELLRDSGVDVANIAELASIRSGHAIIQVDDRGENCILLFAGANHAIPAEIPARALAGAGPHDWLLMQNECGDSAPSIRQALDLGLRVALNPAPMEAAVARLPLERIDLLFFNEGEARVLLQALGAAPATPDDPRLLLEHLQARYPRAEIVLTLGGQGALYAGQGQQLAQPAFTVPVRDTTGAGDTLVGYFLAARSAGAPPTQALRLAQAAAALCVQRAGAADSIPRRGDVEAFLQGQGR